MVSGNKKGIMVPTGHELTLLDFFKAARNLYLPHHANTFLYNVCGALAKIYNDPITISQGSVSNNGHDCLLFQPVLHNFSV